MDGEGLEVGVVVDVVAAVGIVAVAVVGADAAVVVAAVVAVAAAGGGAAVVTGTRAVLQSTMVNLRTFQ